MLNKKKQEKETRPDEGEGCEGNEGSTEDTLLPILFAIAELGLCCDDLLLFSTLFKPKLTITLPFTVSCIVYCRRRYVYAFTAFTAFTLSFVWMLNPNPFIANNRDPHLQSLAV